MDDDTTKAPDLKTRLKQMTQPFMDTLDTKLSAQVDKRVDERVTERVDEILRDRLAVLERAVSDLDRAVKELQAKKTK